MGVMALYHLDGIADSVTALANTQSKLMNVLESFGKSLASLQTTSQEGKADKVYTPYRDLGAAWIAHMKSDSDWLSDDIINRSILDESQYSAMLRELEVKGIELYGVAGVGKSFISRCIGYSLVNSHSDYKGFYELTIPCGMMSHYELSFGEDVNAVMHEGALVSAMKLAEEHSDYAFVVILEEISRCDIKTYLSKIYSILGDGKIGNNVRAALNYRVDNQDVRVGYMSNLYLICTSNSQIDSFGGNNSVVSADDSALGHRFRRFTISGVFGSSDDSNSFDKFKFWLENYSGLNKRYISCMVRKLNAVHSALVNMEKESGRSKLRLDLGNNRLILDAIKTASVNSDGTESDNVISDRLNKSSYFESLANNPKKYSAYIDEFRKTM